MQKMMANGWNTWNVRSVLSHVHLPEGFAISLGIKTYSNGCCLREALIGRKGKGDENYHADTGTGCDIGSSDAFYHWGGLLGLISVMENGGMK